MLSQIISMMGAPSIAGTGNLYGAGTISIPGGVTLVTLTGAGGSGGSNYDPGQAYIAPSGGTWSGGTYSVTSASGPLGPYSFNPGYAAVDSLQGTSAGASANGATRTQNEDYYSSGTGWFVYGTTYTVVGGTQSTYYPGQPYIAPSGGNTYGTHTTATLNSVTDTWTGGLGTGVVGTSSVQTLASTGAGQTLSYSVGSGGNLSYAY